MRLQDVTLVQTLARELVDINSKISMLEDKNVSFLRIAIQSEYQSDEVINAARESIVNYFVLKQVEIENKLKALGVELYDN